MRRFRFRAVSWRGAVPDPSTTNFGATCLTKQNINPSRVSGLFLKDRFTTLLIAVCAKQMHWFGRTCLFLQRISKSASARRTFGTYVHELILLLLSIPCFKVSHFFFKLTYSLQQRRLRRLGRECALLGGDDLSLQFDCFRPNDASVAGIYQELRKIRDGLKRAKQGGEIGNIGHGDSSPNESQQPAASSNSVIDQR